MFAISSPDEFLVGVCELASSVLFLRESACAVLLVLQVLQ